MTKSQVNLDDLDRQMLAQLAQNARLPVAALAKRLGIARSTAQARLDRLEVSGVIAGYTLRLGEAARASRVHATVLLGIEPRTNAQVLQRLRVIPEVTLAHNTTGRFDLIVILATASTEELDGILDRIGMIPGVKSSETLIHLSTQISRAV